MVAALSNSSLTAGGNQDNAKPKDFQLVNTASMNEILSDANLQQILAAAKDASNEQTVDAGEEPCVGDCGPPPSCEVLGTCEPPPPQAGGPAAYAVGVFGQPVEGILHDVLFDPQSNSISFGVSGGEIIYVRFNVDGPISGTVTRDDTDFGTVQFQGGTSLSPELRLDLHRVRLSRLGALGHSYKLQGSIAKPDDQPPGKRLVGRRRADKCRYAGRAQWECNL